MRLCDYVVDPVFTSPSTAGPQFAHQRYQGACSASSSSDVPSSPVLGLSVDVFAPAIAALTDHEEMVLALVHPLVQVYTIPRTGQLAYMGHIHNLRQKVTKFLHRKSLLYTYFLGSIAIINQVLSSRLICTDYDSHLLG